jgi:hypothetical protein
MRYIKLENNTLINYTIEQLLADHPDAVIYKNTKMPSAQLLANYNVYPLITTPAPLETDDTVASEGVPEFKDNEWHQTWVTRTLTEEELLAQLESQKQIEIPVNFLVDSETSTSRYNTCKACERYNSLTSICKECGCFMIVKTKIHGVVCPLGKW